MDPTQGSWEKKRPQQRAVNTCQVEGAHEGWRDDHPSSQCCDQRCIRVNILGFGLVSLELQVYNTPDGNARYVRPQHTPIIYSGVYVQPVVGCVYLIMLVHKQMGWVFQLCCGVDFFFTSGSGEDIAGKKRKRRKITTNVYVTTDLYTHTHGVISSNLSFSLVLPKKGKRKAFVNANHNRITTPKLSHWVLFHTIRSCAASQNT